MLTLDMFCIFDCFYSWDKPSIAILNGWYSCYDFVSEWWYIMLPSCILFFMFLDCLGLLLLLNKRKMPLLEIKQK